MKAVHKFAAWLAAAALLAGVGALISFSSFDRMEDAVRARKEAYVVLQRAKDLLSELKDAETGQRGYLLSGNTAFLEPYLAVVDGLNGKLADLRKLTVSPAAVGHLDAVAPLIREQLADMSRLIEMRRTGETRLAALELSRGLGRRNMDAIRVEMRGFLQIEEAALAQREAELQSKLEGLFNIILVASLLTLLLSMFFVYLIYRETRRRVQRTVLRETQRLLTIQEDISRQLQHANANLQSSEERLDVTLNSIVDAVIATDAQACVTLMNAVAEKLTGWTRAQATGRPVNEIFHIISKEARQPVAVPVLETLARGTVHGLANHTVLIARDGRECDIAESCAPIRDHDARVIGAVLVFRDVTQEYAVRQAAKDSSALIRTILDTVADGIITLRARDGIVATVNPAAERMFGYTATELIGQKFSVLIPELDRDQHIGNGSLDYYSASDEARAIGRSREVVGRRKDGSSFAVETAVSEMWLGGQRYLTGILRDVTARKRVESALLKAGALQSAIFNSANFSCIATDTNGVIQLFNVGAQRMLGYAAADVIDRITPADLHDPDEVIARATALGVEYGIRILPRFEALVFKAARGIEDIYEVTKIRKDGSKVPVLLSVTALRDDQAQIIGYLLIGIDNTARKQVEAERALLDQALRDKNAELERARVLADKANSAKSDFLSSMSHELRTPLNAILGFAQLMALATPPPTPLQRRNLDQILKAGWYLLELINEILDLALIESGKVMLSSEPVSLTEVMLECRSMIESQAHKRGLEMAFTPLAEPWYVKADRTRIKQVLINLLSNAVKYNQPDGSVTVTCAAHGPESIRISIRDTGAGLSTEQLAHLFESFNRLGQETGLEEGTGIGLVVTKRLVEMMGGTIGVESRVGAGSLFWFELQRTTAPQFAVHDALDLTLAARPVAPDAPLQTVLYVEDNPANLELVGQLIARRPDLQLLSAPDGILGVEFARTYLPQVILMDINLPGISGIDAMKLLRADPSTTHIPIIALSANAVPHDIATGMAAGFSGYLTKPIKIDQFMLALDAALAHSSPAIALATPAKPV